MNSVDPRDETAAIRRLLLDAFTDASLSRFCLDDPALRPICDDFGSGMSFNDMVDRVIVYCMKHSVFDRLLASIKIANPDQYAAFESTRHVPIALEDVPAHGKSFDRNVERPTVMIDESYMQAGWIPSPTARAGYCAAVDELSNRVRVVTNQRGYMSPEILDQCQMLILPTPYDMLVSEPEYDQVVDWVCRGGRLLVFGFYLMDLHHRNNLNHLARRFGFEFCHNIMMPIGKETIRDCKDQAFASNDSEYCIVSRPFGTPDRHPILKDVSSLVLTSSCAVEPAGRTELEVQTSEPVSIMGARGYKNSEGRILSATDYPIERQAPASFMVALKHDAGRVVGIGTWKIFLNDVNVPMYDNMRLLHNIIDWFFGTLA